MSEQGEGTDTAENTAEQERAPQESATERDQRFENEAMPLIDIWGINAYRGIDHRELFDAWAAASDKPMYLGEYGADAWDSRGSGQLNLEAQAEATRELTVQIMDRYTGREGGVASGGFIFEWADEWWKDASGSPDVQDTGGAAPGGGPHPDQVFNEEFWGIVDIERNPRPAYEVLRELYTGSSAP